MQIVTVTAGLPLDSLLARVTLHLTPILVASFDTAVAVLFTLILSQTLSNATLVLYERGDLDLLLSSPVPAQRVLAVRALAIAVTPFPSFAGPVTPFLVPILLFGQPHWLAADGMLGGLALSATAVGLVAAMGLFRLIGPRRTRTAGQLLAAFVGAGFFVGAQARNFFPGKAPSLLSLLKSLAAAGYFRPGAAIAWPARAVMGEPWATSTFMLSAALLFAATVGVLGTRFSRDASLAAGVAVGAPQTIGRRDFSQGRRGVFQVLVGKELKLLRRDPALLSLVLLRVLYFLPLVFVLVRSAVFRMVGQVEIGAGVLVFASSQVAASLAWITGSAEDARDFLLSAPVGINVLRVAKVVAALLPLAAILALPIV